MVTSMHGRARTASAIHSRRPAGAGAEELDLLRGLGCGHGQGFLFARPLPPEDVLELLTGALARAAAA